MLQDEILGECSWTVNGFILLVAAFAYLDLSFKEHQRDGKPRYLLRSYQFNGWLVYLYQLFRLFTVNRVNNTPALTHVKP
jgi:hypothetical protein